MGVFLTHNLLKKLEYRMVMQFLINYVCSCQTKDNDENDVRNFSMLYIIKNAQ